MRVRVKCKGEGGGEGKGEGESPLLDDPHWTAIAVPSKARAGEYEGHMGPTAGEHVGHIGARSGEFHRHRSDLPLDRHRRILQCLSRPLASIFRLSLRLGLGAPRRLRLRHRRISCRLRLRHPRRVSRRPPVLRRESNEWSLDEWSLDEWSLDE